MGNRYILSVKCPDCGTVDDDAYYAPTCDFVEWTCECGTVVDLEELTGISYEEASNAAEPEALIEAVDLWWEDAGQGEDCREGF